MTEYISKEAVIKKIAEVQDKATTGTEDVAYYRAIKIIRDEPASSAKWVLFDKDCMGRAFYCSNCRKVTTTEDFENTPLEREEYFCSRCGARMDGEQNET